MIRLQYLHLGSIFIILIYISIVSSQTESKRSNLTEFGVGARANVLKATYVSIANDYSATHWNPAGITLNDKISLGGMYFKMPFNRQINFISLIFPVSSKDKLGFSWEEFLINDIPARQGNTIAPDYYFQNKEQAIWLTYSRKIISRLSLGFNFKYLHHTLSEINAMGWGLDTGLMFMVNQKIRLGFVIYDISSQLKWSTGHIDYYRKLNRLGISYKIMPSLCMALALEGNYPQFKQMVLGTEVKVTDPIYMRMGWQNQKLSLGMGITFDFINSNLTFNYAISTNKISNQLSHICDLSISFRRPGTLRKLPNKNRSKFVIIECAALNVRTGPGIKYKKIGTIYKNQKFMLVEKKSKWFKIKYSKNRTGWIRNSYAKIISY